MKKPFTKAVISTFILYAVTIGASPLMSTGALAGEKTISTLRPAPLNEDDEAPAMTPQYNKDLKQVRNYPEQPPLIPHKIEGYQVTKNANKCLDCHDRKAVGESQAPMVSITHFMDRDGQFLAEVSPRRYFCNQCHVPQHETKPLVENTFVDMTDLVDHLDKQEKKDK